jgi:uncharacterized protein (DUF58 family)
MVRQEDRPARRTATILLDPRADAHRGAGAHSSFEWAVSAAASLVSHLSGLGYAVHLICAETVQDGQAAMTTEPDRALDVLAEADTAPPHSLDEMVRAAHPVVASGGLVVALVADLDEEALRQVASLRQPGGSGLAVVLDTRSFAAGGGTAGSPSAPGAAAAAYADLLHTAGWSVTTVGDGDRLSDAWSALTTRKVHAR